MRTKLQSNGHTDRSGVHLAKIKRESTGTFGKDVGLKRFKNLIKKSASKRSFVGHGETLSGLRTKQPKRTKQTFPGALLEPFLCEVCGLRF